VSAASDSRTPVHAGGCQCGSVRFAVYVEPARIGICHCRMCQKAVAGPFAVLAEVPWSAFAWSKGQPSAFRSSSRAMRDFCAACGTPLSYRKPGGDIIELLTGAFDHPERVAPTYAVGIESRLAWLAGLNQLPGKTTLDNIGAERLAAIESFQHLDESGEDDDQRG
jgi:hypothetical protein